VRQIPGRTQTAPSENGTRTEALDQRTPAPWVPGWQVAPGIRSPRSKGETVRDGSESLLRAVDDRGPVPMLVSMVNMSDSLHTVADFGLRRQTLDI
jgi:hypothetical protein